MDFFRASARADDHFIDHERVLAQAAVAITREGLFLTALQRTVRDDLSGNPSHPALKVRRMAMKRTLQMAASRPDRLGEQLVTTLVERSWFEFKPLFLQVYASLRERNFAHGGEEMLRLSAYDKLQNMVRKGLVEKDGKMYRGKLPELTNYAESVAAAQSRVPLQVAACAE